MSLIGLGPVLDAAALCATCSPDTAVQQLRAPLARTREQDVLNKDVARLPPLRHTNINVPGRHGFRASTPVDGGLIRLRDPATTDTSEDEED
ncbi:hypothetical protein [Streptomyces sp. NPDC054783]